MPTHKKHKHKHKRKHKRRDGEGGSSQVSRRKERKVLKNRKRRRKEVEDGRVCRKVLTSMQKDLEAKSKELSRPDNRGNLETSRFLSDMADRVSRPREAALASMVLLGTIRYGHNQVSNVNTTFDELTPHSMNQAVLHRHGDDPDAVDFAALGKALQATMRHTPRLTCVYGPLGFAKPPRVRVRRVAQKVQRKAPVRPKTIDKSQAKNGEEDQGGDSQKAETVARIAEIWKILKRVKECPMFALVINPHSYSQSVENLFHLAFLIKDGRAKITVDDGAVPIVSFVSDADASAIKQSENTQRKQAILPLDFARWHQLTQLHGLTESMIPDRTPQQH